MGDAEYDTVDMLLWLQENTKWCYVLRTSPQICVTTELGKHAIGDISLERNHVVQYLHADFMQNAALEVNLVGWWSDAYDESAIQHLLKNTGLKTLEIFSSLHGEKEIMQTDLMVVLGQI